MRLSLWALLALGTWVAGANAGVLWMEFSEGGTEATLQPAETVTLKVWLTPGPLDVSESIDNVTIGFNVTGPLVLQVVGELEGPTGWEDGTYYQPANSEDHVFGPPGTHALFLVYGDTAELPIEITDEDPLYLMGLVLQNNSTTADADVSITFANISGVPDIALGVSSWSIWTQPGDPSIGGAYTVRNDELTIRLVSEGGGGGGGGGDDGDGDGVPDDEDDFPEDAEETTDTDNDGIGNNADTDDDDDGTSDEDDAFPEDPDETTDTDDDGTGNNADTDDDNDGVADGDDADPLDPTVGQTTGGSTGGGAARSPCGLGMISALPLGMVGLLLLHGRRRWRGR